MIEHFFNDCNYKRVENYDLDHMKITLKTNSYPVQADLVVRI